jgi:drug/metabolite transporter (DMT)-like permease
MFMGALLLFAAVILWGLSLMMSPHGESVARGTEHVRNTIVTFVAKNAIGTLVLSALSAWLLFPARRPNKPKRDYAILAVLTVLIASSIYQLAWLQISVLR